MSRRHPRLRAQIRNYMAEVQRLIARAEVQPQSPEALAEIERLRAELKKLEREYQK